MNRLIKNFEQKLSNNTIIYWNLRKPELGKEQKTPVKCGGCSEVRTVIVPVSKLNSNNWSGHCNKCAVLSASDHPLWINGKTLSKEGYVYIHKSLLSSEEQTLFASMFTKADYCLEHRLAIARHLNRPLTKFEKVHHINEQKDDNRVENLNLTNDSEHMKYHFARVSKLNSRIHYLESILDNFNIKY